MSLERACMNMSILTAKTKKPIAKGTIAFSLATIALLVLSAYFYTQINVLQTQIEEKDSSIESLEREYQQLQSEINVLQTQIEEKDSSIESLEREYKQLQFDYDMYIAYLTIVLEGKFEEDYAYLTVPMPRGLDEHYYLLRRYEIGKLSNRDFLLFYVTAVFHDLGNYSYDHCIEFRGYGEDCIPLTAIFAERFLGYINKSYPNVSNVSRVQQVYDWVNTFVRYRNLITRFPIETLTFRCGDCDDQAMALCFLLEACGYETAVCGIGDENLTQYSPRGFFHVFTAVRKKNFEYNGTLVQLNGYPEYGNNWILLDPTFDHPFGRDPEWIEFYRMENGTVHIPQEVWDCLPVDYNELVNRAKELGITLNT